MPERPAPTMSTSRCSLDSPLAVTHARFSQVGWSANRDVGLTLSWAAVNVLIAADMEGITGIDDCGDCLPSHPAGYARGRRLMTDEVLVAIAALREAGAGRISVGDWHMVGTNIERERMPAGVEVRPIAHLALTEAEPSMAKAHGGDLDAVVMLGHHAATKT